jgi:MATE family multidrug resistance protein
MKLLPRKEYSKKILSMAAPAIAGLSSQMIVSIVNAAMIGRLENAHIQLAAMGLGVLATWAITSFFSSLSTGTHVLAARRHGEGNYIGVGQVLNNSLLLSLVLGIIIAVIGYQFSFEVVDFFSKNKQVSDAGAAYLKYQFLGLPFFLLVVSYRGFFYGIGHTKIFMNSAIIINVCNIVLNYLFVFGIGGLPKMELAGLGIGYALSLAVGCFYFIVVTFLLDYRKQYGYYSQFGFSLDIIKHIVKISIPVSLQNLLILVGFLVFVAITGYIGVIEQAASQVVISALFISLMPCFGFGIAAQTLVGQSLGQGNPKLAQIFGYETAKITTVFTFALGLLFVLIPDAVLIVITTNEQIINVARPILRIAGIAQVFYGSGIVIANALQAGGATLYVMFVEVITHWIIFLPLAYGVGIMFQKGLVGAWMALPFYVIIFTLMNFWKFRSLNWVDHKL